MSAATELKNFDSVRKIVGERGIFGPEDWDKFGIEIQGKIPDFPFEADVLEPKFAEEHFFFLGQSFTVVEFFSALERQKETSLIPEKIPLHDSFRYEKCHPRWHALCLDYRRFLNKKTVDEWDKFLLSEQQGYRVPLAATGIMGLFLSILKGNNFPENLFFQCRDKIINGAGKSPAVSFSKGVFSISLISRAETSPNAGVLVVRFG